MRRATKIWLIIAAVLILSGAALFCVTMAANGWDYSGFASIGTETVTYEVKEDFHSIVIRSDTEDIELIPADDSVCRLVFVERETEKHTYSVQDGTLTIGKGETGNWYEQGSLFTTGEPSITLYLPKTAYASLFIEEHTGAVLVPKDFSFGSVSIFVTTGDVDCSASSSGAVRIGTDTGDIRVGNVSVKELDLSVSTGKVEVRSAAAEGDVSVRVTTGRTELTDVSCANLSTTGSTGKLRFENVICAGKLSAKRSTGDVTFLKCDAGEILVETSTGDVTGTLLTDKVFIIKTDTGRIEVPESITGGKCKITTDTGDIKIGIE